MSQNPAINAVIDLGNVSGSVAIDASRGNFFRMVLTGATTLVLSNIKPGQPCGLSVSQDGAGGHSLAFGGQTIDGGAAGFSMPQSAAAQATLSLIGSTANMTTVQLTSLSPVPSGGVIPSPLSGPGTTAALKALIQTSTLKNPLILQAGITITLDTPLDLTGITPYVTTTGGDVFIDWGGGVIDPSRADDPTNFMVRIAGVPTGATTPVAGPSEGQIYPGIERDMSVVWFLAAGYSVGQWIQVFGNDAGIPQGAPSAICDLFQIASIDTSTPNHVGLTTPSFLYHSTTNAHVQAVTPILYPRWENIVLNGKKCNVADGLVMSFVVQPNISIKGESFTRALLELRDGSTGGPAINVTSYGDANCDVLVAAHDFSLTLRRPEHNSGRLYTDQNGVVNGQARGCVFTRAYASDFHLLPNSSLETGVMGINSWGSVAAILEGTCRNMDGDLYLANNVHTLQYNSITVGGFGLSAGIGALGGVGEWVQENTFNIRCSMSFEDCFTSASAPPQQCTIIMIDNYRGFDLTGVRITNTGTFGTGATGRFMNGMTFYDNIEVGWVGNAFISGMQYAVSFIGSGPQVLMGNLYIRAFDGDFSDFADFHFEANTVRCVIESLTIDNADTVTMTTAAPFAGDPNGEIQIGRLVNDQGIWDNVGLYWFATIPVAGGIQEVFNDGTHTTPACRNPSSNTLDTRLLVTVPADGSDPGLGNRYMFAAKGPRRPIAMAVATNPALNSSVAYQSGSALGVAADDGRALGFTISGQDTTFEVVQTNAAPVPSGTIPTARSGKLALIPQASATTTGAVALNALKGNNQNVVMTGNISDLSITGAENGQTLKVTITGTAVARTLALDATIHTKAADVTALNTAIATNANTVILTIEAQNSSLYLTNVWSLL